MPKPKKPKTIMRAFKVNEISAVDDPAQAKARAVLMKRRESGDAAGEEQRPEEIHVDFSKRTALTSAVDGHTHLLQVNEDYQSGYTGWSSGHSHPWVMDGDAVVIGEEDGHTHEVVAGLSESGSVKKSLPADDPAGNTISIEEDPTMTHEEIVARLEKQLKEQEAELAKAKAFGALNDSEKALYAQLGKASQESFLAKSAVERSIDVRKAQEAALEADPVVFKAADGTEYRKSVGDVALRALKAADEARAKAREAEARADVATFEKRADSEMGHLPGESGDKGLVLKAIGTLPEGERERALKVVQSSDAALSKLFQQIPGGRTEVLEDQPSGVDAQLRELAKKRAETTGEPFHVAQLAVYKTKEGKELLRKNRDERRERSN